MSNIFGQLVSFIDSDLRKSKYNARYNYNNAVHVGKHMQLYTYLQKKINCWLESKYCTIVGFFACNSGSKSNIFK
jgi:hypothetical protein